MKIASYIVRALLLGAIVWALYAHALDAHAGTPGDVSAVTICPPECAVRPDPAPVYKLRRCASARCVPAVVRYVFGKRAHLALRIVACETGGTFSPRTVGDGGSSHGIWQIHLPAHPGVTLAQARSPWLSTQLAWRWSRHGTDFSPTWTCATRLGIR